MKSNAGEGLLLAYLWKTKMRLREDRDAFLAVVVVLFLVEGVLLLLLLVVAVLMLAGRFS